MKEDIEYLDFNYKENGRKFCLICSLAKPFRVDDCDNCMHFNVSMDSLSHRYHLTKSVKELYERKNKQ